MQTIDDRPRSFLSQKPKKASFWPVAVWALISAMASVVAWLSKDLREAWIANPHKIFVDGEWWRVAASMMIHADIGHLLSNFLFIVPFGGLLTHYFGWRSFPWAAIVLGIAAQVISLKTYPEGTALIGASGLLYVQFGLWLSLYFRAETQLPWSHRLMRIVGFGLIMFVPAEFQPDVSYRTHAIGLGLGLVAGALIPFSRPLAPQDHSESALPQ